MPRRATTPRLAAWRSQLDGETAGALRGGTLLDRRLDPGAWAPRLSRLGGVFVEHLHGHHQVEDRHYFPLLVARDARLEGGFAILDRDHHALDGHLDAFVGEADAALRCEYRQGWVL